eukprot:gene16693-18387_t
MEAGKIMFKKLLMRCGFVCNMVCIVHCISEYCGEFTMCLGPSMQPTLNNKSDGDIVITEHISRKYHNLKRGDVVIAKCPSNPQTMICKRIAAMAGDIIETPKEKDDYIKVPKGHVWLLGDNANNSTDSRVYGPVPYGLLRGRVWPLDQFGKV